MTREKMLDEMIRIYGFEHEVVKQFAHAVENPNIDDHVLALLLLLHQECPVDMEDED